MESPLVGDVKLLTALLTADCWAGARTCWTWVKKKPLEVIKIATLATGCIIHQEPQPQSNRQTSANKCKSPGTSSNHGRRLTAPNLRKSSHLGGSNPKALVVGDAWRLCSMAKACSCPALPGLSKRLRSN